MIKAVVLAVHHYPKVCLVPLWVVEMVNDHFCHPGVVGIAGLVLPEGNHRVCWGVAISEHQA